MSRYHNRLLIILASALVGFSTTCAAYAAGEVAIKASSSHASVGELRYFDGGEQDTPLKTKGAKLTILHFWATWCAPCIEELPPLAAMQKTYSGKGVRVIALALDGGNRAKIDQFYAAHHITGLAFASDHKSAVSQALKVRTLPASVFLNEKGEEIGRAAGPVDWKGKEAQAFIEKAIAP